MVILSSLLRLPVAPVPGGIPIGAMADLPRFVTGPAVILGVPSMWSSSSCWGVGTAPLVQVVGQLVLGFVLVKQSEHYPARPRSPPLIPVSE